MISDARNVSLRNESISSCRLDNVFVSISAEVLAIARLINVLKDKILLRGLFISWPIPAAICPILASLLFCKAIFCALSRSL